MPPRLLMRGIEKRFGGVRALRGVDLCAEAGEIHGLCGENGAGKSTLLKILGGIYPHGDFTGEVHIDGESVQLRGPRDAQARGVALVHQELMLVEELTVAENLLLCREPRRLGFLLDGEALLAGARDLLRRHDFAAGIDPAVKVSALGMGLRQLVEIARALSLDARILVLDEPTAALTEEEAGRLQAILRRLRAGGTTCLYVSHRLDEVFALCDRVTVLRDGQTVGTARIAETSMDEVVAQMVGRTVQRRRPAPPPRQPPSRPPALQVMDLSLRLPARGARAFAVRGVSLSVAAGEVVAVCGAMGSGRTALLSTLFGAGRGEVSGEVRVDGVAVRTRDPRQAIDHGLALLPEDRKGQGLVLSMSVADNLALPGGLGPGRRLHREAEEQAAARLAERLGLRTLSRVGARGDVSLPAASLSGGNQQKVALGKWMAAPPRVLLLDEPTRGVDIGAREEIYALIESLCQAGVGVLLASSDLQEVLRLAHRVVVLRDGAVAGILDAAPDGSQGSLTQEDIVRLSTGAQA